MDTSLANFTDALVEEIENSQPLSFPSSTESRDFVACVEPQIENTNIPNSQPLSLPSSTESRDFVACVEPQIENTNISRPAKGTGQHGDFRCVEEIDPKYRHIFTYRYFNLVQSSVIDDALYSDKSMVVCAPTGSGKTVVFEMAIIHLLMELEDKSYTGDFKIIYMAPVKALCAERLSEWYPKFTKLGLMCIEVTGDTDVDFSQLQPYRIIVTTPEKWDMLTRRWRDHRGLVDVIKLFLIDEVHILNDEARGPVLEAVVSRMKTIEASQQAAHRIEQLQKHYTENSEPHVSAPTINLPRIRFVAVSATVSNPEDVAAWLGTNEKPAVYYKFGDECRPVKLKRVVEGYPCPPGTSIFKFDIILSYRLWPVIQKYNDGKPTLIFCSTRKSVELTADILSRELTINFTPQQKARLTALASSIKTKKLQALVLNGVGCHHAGLLYEERNHIEEAFRNSDLPILITTTTLAMGVNLPAHLVIIKSTQQYVNGQYQEYSITTVLQMVGRAGRPQFDTEATAVIMTRQADKHRYSALVGGDEPLQSYLHKRLPENLNSEAALGTVGDVAQCVQWLRSTFLSVRAAKDPRRYLGLAMNAPPALITKKIEELCVKAMNGLASAGLITMDEASCIQSTEVGRLMSVFYLDLETMKQIMKIEGNETLEKLLWIVCECHELSDMHLRVDERRTLNALNRNTAAATIRFPMKGKISTRQMKLNCIIQAVLGCLPIQDPSLNQEAMRVMRIVDRICKCLVAYVTRPALISTQSQYYSAVLNSLLLAKCVAAHLWENSPYVSKQLKGIGPTFSTLLATAGKVNFTLLEESHPRDLERVMNKGAPAGNVLRKQVSLLPKYQLTATPVDDKRVTIKLMLINQSYMAENREQLTATDAHKCYIVAGDSENHLLYFTSFKDKDLIGVYDGVITLEITRKHRFEHKVFVHCISSSWVGLDVKCDYVFKSIEPIFMRAEAVHQMPVQNTPKKVSKKQSCITDIYKQRKRKPTELDITKSKEMKKRESAIIEKINVLKNSFEETSKELKGDVKKSAQMSNLLTHDITQEEGWSNSNTSIDVAMGDITYDFQTIEPNNHLLQNEAGLTDENTLIDDDHINTILHEIETDFTKTKTEANLTDEVRSSFYMTSSPTDNHLQSNLNRFPKLDIYKQSANAVKKRKITKNKSNFNFKDRIERENNSDRSYDANILQNDTGFSNTIKSQIENLLRQTSNKNSHIDYGIKELLEPNEIKNCDTTEETKLVTNHTTKMTEEINNMPMSHELSPICSNSGGSSFNISSRAPQMPYDGTPNNKIKTTGKPELDKETDSDRRHIIIHQGPVLSNANCDYLINSDNKNNELRHIQTKLINVGNTVDAINQKEFLGALAVENNCKFRDNMEKLKNVVYVTTNETIDTNGSIKHSKTLKDDIIIDNESSNGYYDESPFNTSLRTQPKCINGTVKNKIKAACEPEFDKETICDDNHILINHVLVINNKNRDYLVTNENNNEKAMIIGNELYKIETQNIEVGNTVDAICERQCINTTGLDDESESEDDTENAKKDLILTCNKTIDTKRCLKMSKALKDNIIIENEFKDHFDEDIESVGRAIKSKKRYENDILHPTSQTQTESPVNSLTYKNANILETIPQTGMQLKALVDQDIPRSFSASTTKISNFKKPSFIPPFKQTSIEKAHDIFKTIYKPHANRSSNQLGDNNSYTKVNRNIKTNISSTSDVNTPEDYLQEVSSSLTTQQKHKKRNIYEYKKQYSFSAMKINVSTAEMPNHQLQIIRKVKLDLDVTEIMSKVDTSNQKTTKHENSNQNEEQHCDRTDINLHSELPKFRFVDSHKNLNETSKDNLNLNYKRKVLKLKNFYKPETSKTFSYNKKSDQNYKTEQEEQQLRYSNIEGNSDDGLSFTEINVGVIDQYSNDSETRKDTLPAMLTLSHNKNNPQNYINEKTSTDKIKKMEEKNNDSQDIGNKAENSLVTKIGNHKLKTLSLIDGNSTSDVNSEFNCENETTENIPKAKNNIGNIIGKYSALVRKNKSISNNIKIKMSPKTNTNTKKVAVDKAKRSYKINDIYNLEIPLPKTLISAEAKRTPRPTQTDIVPKKYVEPYEVETLKNNTVRVNIPEARVSITHGNIKTTFSKAKEGLTPDELEIIEPEPPKTQNIGYRSNIKNDMQDEICENLSPIDDIPALEIVEDFDLDQSMLNPKTLLQQCFTKDDELIITPPSDFCDTGSKNIYSPTKAEEDNEWLQYSSYQDFDRHHEDTTLDVSSRSIFEDNNCSQLTPSKEIETWTFSHHDPAELNTRRFHNQKNPAIESCTVMRSISPENGYVYTALCNRRIKLNQFKFSGKKKLRL